MGGFDTTDLFGIPARRESPLHVDRVVVEEEDGFGGMAERVGDMVEDRAVGFHEANLMGEEASFEEFVDPGRIFLLGPVQFVGVAEARHREAGIHRTHQGFRAREESARPAKEQLEERLGRDVEGILFHHAPGKCLARALAAFVAPHPGRGQPAPPDFGFVRFADQLAKVMDAAKFDQHAAEIEEYGSGFHVWGTPLFVAAEVFAIHARTKFSPRLRGRKSSHHAGPVALTRGPGGSGTLEAMGRCKGMPWIAAGAGLLVWLGAGTAAATVEFQVSRIPGFGGLDQAYVLPLADPADIAHARALVSEGIAAGAPLVVAKIAAGADGVNRNTLAPGEPPWSWHVTEFQAFGDMAIELCDGSPQMVENDVAGWIANTGGQICFWSYTVTAELPVEVPALPSGPALVLMLGLLGAAAARSKASR